MHWPHARSLKQAAAKHGRFYGAASRIDQLQAEPRLRDALLKDCVYVTPEIHMKWDAIEAQPGRRTFALADGLVDFAMDNGLKVRGHTLLWERSTPAWAIDRLRGSRDWGTIQDHFEAVLPRYRGRIQHWDVVNEPIDVGQNALGLRENVFFQSFGPDYLPRSLDAANRLAPDAKLFINDYGFDYDNPVEERRREALLKLLTRLKRSGAPLHAVGLQAHLSLAKGPLKTAILKPFLRGIADLGLQIVITELDVKEADLQAPTEERDARVAAETRAYLDIVLAQPAVKGVLTWGLSDQYSWLQDDLPAAAPANRGLPYDAALKPKPMYWAMRDGLEQIRPA